jgi:hypothetical protein
MHYNGTPWCKNEALPDDTYCAEHREFIDGKGTKYRGTRDWNKLYRELQLNGNNWLYAGAYRKNDKWYAKQHGYVLDIRPGEYGGQLCYVKRGLHQ